MLMVELDKLREKLYPRLPVELQHSTVLAALELALGEDLAGQSDTGTTPAGRDITSLATLPEDIQLTGRIKTKAPGVVAGLPVVTAVFFMIDEKINVTHLAQDGEVVVDTQQLARVQGNGRNLLAGERTALNFLGRMSGIASLTRRFVQAVAGTQAVILDTRKTAPGLRYLDKYAVRMGGGQNHRIGLFDMVLIKDNHISGAGGITPAVKRVHERFGSRYAVEVEVKNLDELREVLGLEVQRIMLDNMDLEMMHAAVKLTAGQTPLEASGNVSLENIRQIAETGVDFISVGALTHSAPVLDISMKIG
jgi:nicotinate-nucleotide pyrophosphorylase (carboxylating)